MRMLLISLILFISVQVWGQAVRVLDRSDLQPIENVLIYNRNSRKTALANRNGEAKFDLLQMTDTLVFQHPSYHELELSYATIKKNRNQAFLSLRAYDLEQITVSAYRWEESRQDIPTKVTSIPAREVAFQNPQTAADLLGSSHEVFVQKSQLGGGSPMLRGFAANSVLLVVDGVRMNNAIYRSGNLHNVIALDANFIDNTEVVFGPGSVIYGSDALGGVMIFHTHQPRLSNSNTMTFSVRPLLRYSSANGEKTANILIDVGKQRWASSTVISRSEFGNLHTGSHRSSKFPEFGKRTEYVVWNGKKDSIVANKDVNVMTPSGYDQLNISQKIRFKPGANSDFIYGFHYSTSSNIPRFDRLIEYRSGKLRFAEWYYGPQKWMMHNLNIRLYDSNFFFNNSKITLAYQFNEESRHDRRLNQFVRTSRIEKVHAFILNADFQKLISGHSSLFYGIEGFYNDVLSKARAEDIRTNAISPASTRYPDGSNQYAGLAGYAMLKKRLSSTFVLHTGLRYSRVMLESILKDTVFYNFPFRKISIHAGALNGIAGLTTRLLPDLQININFSTGFRAPNLDDAGKVFESAPGSVVVPNPNLKP
ncbi:MAG: TonB-dependent receptor, partial [Bacteroidales bacterium]|nr:TonB-dependent receptor [Bacteroidales bacterium]